MSQNDAESADAALDQLLEALTDALPVLRERAGYATQLDGDDADNTLAAAVVLFDAVHEARAKHHEADEAPDPDES